MIVIKNNNKYNCDVDETLVLFDYPPEFHDATILIGCDGFQRRVLPNKYIIDRIKDHKARGHCVTIWTQGGWEWGVAVVQALDLEKYIDVLECKPKGFYDDLPASAFLPEACRSYIDIKTGKGRNG